MSERYGDEPDYDDPQGILRRDRDAEVDAKFPPPLPPLKQRLTGELLAELLKRQQARLLAERERESDEVPDSEEMTLEQERILRESERDSDALTAKQNEAWESRHCGGEGYSADDREE